MTDPTEPGEQTHLGLRSSSEVYRIIARRLARMNGDGPEPVRSPAQSAGDMRRP